LDCFKICGHEDPALRVTWLQTSPLTRRHQINLHLTGKTDRVSSCGISDQSSCRCLSWLFHSHLAMTGAPWRQADTEIFRSSMSFADVGLSDAIVRAVSELGYTHPTPIQQQAIPAVLTGGDLLAGAQTGTGKTAGVTLPILQQLSSRPAKGSRTQVRALILT